MDEPSQSLILLTNYLFLKVHISSVEEKIKLSLASPYFNYILDMTYMYPYN